MYKPDDVIFKKTKEILDFAVSHKDKDTFRLNHFSAASADNIVFFEYYDTFLLTPRHISTYTDPVMWKITEKGSYGMQAMDFPTIDLVNHYIALNFK